MHKSKKAQITDTLSWMVATIIIVLILGVPVFLVKTDMINTHRVNFERVQDTIATKAISGYLLKSYEGLINFEENEKKLSSEEESGIESLLRSLCINGIEGWSLIFLFNEEAIYHKGFYKYSDVGYIVYGEDDWRNYFVSDTKKFDNNFYFDKGENKILFDFYTEGELIKG